jgi:hypothetical protein
MDDVVVTKEDRWAAMIAVSEGLRTEAQDQWCKDGQDAETRGAVVFERVAKAMARARQEGQRDPTREAAYKLVSRELCEIDIESITIGGPTGKEWGTSRLWSLNYTLKEYGNKQSLQLCSSTLMDVVNWRHPNFSPGR